jgi:hypothetical protein
MHSAKTHPTAAQMHTAATEAEAASAPTEVSTTATEVGAAATEVTAAAAKPASGMCGQWRHQGCRRHQQDCANRNSVIFHDYLPSATHGARLDEHTTRCRQGSNCARLTSGLLQVRCGRLLESRLPAANIVKVGRNFAKSMADGGRRDCDK